ncbi:phosphohydrolase, partial [Streptomyces tateyamensis]
GLAPFGERAQQAGWLHDVLEDSPVTADQLLAAGVPAEVVAAVRAVTKVAGEEYLERVRAVTADRLATLVKISDNAHNSHPDRLAALPAEQR